MFLQFGLSMQGTAILVDSYYTCTNPPNHLFSRLTLSITPKLHFLHKQAAGSFRQRYTGLAPNSGSLVSSMKGIAINNIMPLDHCNNDCSKTYTNMRLKVLGPEFFEPGLKRCKGHNHSAPSRSLQTYTNMRLKVFGSAVLGPEFIAPGLKHCNGHNHSATCRPLQ